MGGFASRIQGLFGMESGEWDQFTYMQEQCREICIHKWIESEKAGHDLGAEAIKDWITKYARQFREYAEHSGKYIKSINDPTINN